LRPSRVGQHPRRSAHRVADEIRPRRAAAGVDAVDEGRRDRAGFNLIAPQGPEAPQAEGARGGGRGPQRLGPTQAELTAYLDSVKAKVKGAAVLVGKPAVVPVSFDAEATRM